MNAIVHAEAPRLPAMQSGGSIRPIVPQSMEDAYRLAKAVCMAGMAPKGLDTPERAMIAIMQGMEVGMTPMASLQRIAVVNGRPTIWGDGAMSLVRGSGLCEYVRERVEGQDDSRAAICAVKRRGEPEEVSRRFSVADAKKAGLWGKQGPWQQYPERMLQMRARAFALRDVFADVLGGMYLREEIEDPAREARDVTPPSPPRPPSPTAIAAPAKVEPIEVITATGEVVEAVQEVEPIDYGDYFERMQEAMQGAKDEVDVEEIWNDFDPASIFQDDADSFELAQTIKINRLAALSPLNG